MNEKPQTLKPFGRLCMTIGQLPASYVESMSYYEQLLWLTKYLQEEVIPVVNNNSNVTQELQDYVIHYFDNLDIQEEINNKLDEMAESGQLTDIIAQYLGLAGMITFNTVADMKEAENLVNGSKCATLGYRSVNDGGNAIYKIRNVTNNDNIDEGLIIALNDENLVAELIAKEIYPEMFGAYGDGVHDDTSVFEYIVTLGRTIKCHGNKTYIINELNINTSLNLDGNGATLKASESSDYILKFYSTDVNADNYYKGTITNLILDGDHKANDLILNDNSTRRTFENITLNNPLVNGFHATNIGGGTRLLSINGKQDNLTLNSTFLKIEAADLNINAVDYQNYKIGLYSSSNLQINQFHGYVYPSTSAELTNTKFIELHGGRITATNVYPDTQNFWFYVSDVGDYYINGGFSWHNAGINDTLINGTTSHYVYCVYTENATKTYLRRLHLNNFILSTPSSINNIKFCNVDMPFDITSTSKTHDSNIDVLTWNTTSYEVTSLFGSVNTTNVSSSNVRIKQGNNFAELFGSFTFSDAHTGENYVELFTASDNYKFIQNTSVSYHNCRIGDSLNAATFSDVKILVQNNKLTISKLQGTSLAGKTIYIEDTIPLKNIG